MQRTQPYCWHGGTLPKWATSSDLVPNVLWQSSSSTHGIRSTITGSVPTIDIIRRRRKSSARIDEFNLIGINCHHTVSTINGGTRPRAPGTRHARRLMNQRHSHVTETRGSFRFALVIRHRAACSIQKKFRPIHLLSPPFAPFTFHRVICIGPRHPARLSQRAVHPCEKYVAKWRVVCKRFILIK